MQAQRSFEQPARPRDDAGAPRIAGPLAGEPAASPAHLLWEELAARLQPAPAVAPSFAPRATQKWPAPMRFAIVVGLSSACWAGLYLVAAVIL